MLRMQLSVERSSGGCSCWSWDARLGRHQGTVAAGHSGCDWWLTEESPSRCRRIRLVAGPDSEPRSALRPLVMEKTSLERDAQCLAEEALSCINIYEASDRYSVEYRRVRGTSTRGRVTSRPGRPPNSS